MTDWQTHASRTVYENPWLRLREHEVTKPDGGPGRYGVVEMVNASVFVVALTDQDEVVLVDLFRYTTQSMSTEVPAGGTMARFRWRRPSGSYARRPGSRRTPGRS